MSNAMNLYQKIAKVKGELSRAKLPKTGYNGYTKFGYFQLDDFEPTLERLCADVGIVTFFEFSLEEACMHVVDCDNPDCVINVSTPVHVANGKGGTPMQDIGAMQTYARRYLFMSFFGITESDSLDAVLGMDAQKQNNVQRPSGNPASQPVAQPEGNKNASQQAPQNVPSDEETAKKEAWRKVLSFFGYDSKKAKQNSENTKALNDAKALISSRYHKDSVMNLTEAQVADMLEFISNAPENFESDEIAS